MSALKLLLDSIKESWPTRYEFPHQEIIDKLTSTITERIPPEADRDYARNHNLEWADTAWSKANSKLQVVVEPYLSPDFFLNDNHVVEHLKWNDLYQDIYEYE